MGIRLADEINPWEVEEIPDQDILFYRIHQNWIPNGILNPAAFRNTKPSNGMSTDWDRYSTARDTRRRNPNKPPTNYAVVRLEVGEVKKVPDQTVVQSPKPDNRAHTDVFGDKTPEARIKFSRLADYVYRVDDPDE